MKKLFISYCTEYEAGWGSKPDGLLLCEEKNIIEKEIISQHKKGTPEYYWRYSTPEIVFCDENTWEKIKIVFNDGIFHSSSLSNLKTFGSFYKEL